MKTYIADLIPKIKRYTKELDDLTMLTNQHWVVLDEIEKVKNIYIFRNNNDLLISRNGKVEKAKWDYLGNNSLLIERNNESYLFKHGFFDETILALKIDSKFEYAFLINENKYGEELNSIDKINRFLESKYIQNIEQDFIDEPRETKTNHDVIIYGEIEIKSNGSNKIKPGQKVLYKNKTAPDGKYRMGFLKHIKVKNGLISEVYF